jgi:hypothetical protein
VVEVSAFAALGGAEFSLPPSLRETLARIQ